MSKRTHVWVVCCDKCGVLLNRGIYASKKDLLARADPLHPGGAGPEHVERPVRISLDRAAKRTKS